MLEAIRHTGGMPTYRDEGVVLRTHNLGEADRIITLITREHGQVRAVAKGVRKTKSRFGARLEPFAHVDLQLFEGRNLDIVAQVDTIAAYSGPISTSYPAYTAANALVETALRLLDSDQEPAVQLYWLVVGGLRSLAEQRYDSSLVLDAFMVRAMAIAGWAPSFVDCAKCGAAGPHRAFSIAAGGSVCPGCRPASSAAPHPATLELLAALLSGDWTAAQASQDRHRREAGGLAAAYVQWHVERQVRSLRLVERTSADAVVDLNLNTPETKVS